jgi:hypothetical protein
MVINGNKLVESKDVNAWCMPGGKIVIYSGILPITKDDAGLATVMGHEVSMLLLITVRNVCGTTSTSYWCRCFCCNFRTK